MRIILGFVGVLILIMAWNLASAVTADPTAPVIEVRHDLGHDAAGCYVVNGRVWNVSRSARAVHANVYWRLAGEPLPNAPSRGPAGFVRPGASAVFTASTCDGPVDGYSITFNESELVDGKLTGQTRRLRYALR